MVAAYALDGSRIASELCARYAWMTMPWSRLRRLVQILVLVAVVWITVGGQRDGGQWLSTDPLSRLDPLVGLSAVLASRGLALFWAASLLTVALTIAFGRAWCGWVCPLGTVLDNVPMTSRWRRPPSRAWRLGKYVTLAVVLGAALIGNLGPMILDPVTIITRPLQEIARPFAGNDAVGQSIGATLGRASVHTVAFLALLPLIIVVALELVDHRFWCRNLCPLGGLLALISKVPGIRRHVAEEPCTSCARCAKGCPTIAIDREDGFKSDSAECIVCMSCVDTCKPNATGFELSSKLRLPAYQPSRRQALIATGVTGISLAASVAPVARTDAEIVRPPSTSEKRLAELCVRCGACYGACPTGALRPSVSLTSEAGPWTPMLDERPPHCSLNCNLCAAPCPTDALHTPTEEESLALGLGAIAEVDRNGCRAWGMNKACMKCQAGCPIAGALIGVERPPGLAINHPMGRDPNRFGSVQVPEVDRDLCIGCNQCAAACVVRPPAIGVPAYGTPTSEFPWGDL